MDVIAKARHTLRPHRSYVVKLTLPVPKGTFIPPTSTLPLAIKDLNGVVLRTNVDAVSFYPDAKTDGADVVELQARISNPDRRTDEVELEIVQHEQSRVRPRIEQSAFDILRSQDVVLKAKDVFDNEYTAVLSGLDRETFSIEKYGPASIELVRHVHLTPDSLAGPEALDRLLGVHVVWKVWDRDKVLGIDLHVHNGDSGLTDNAPNDIVYFKSLELWVPEEYQLIHKDLDPAIGDVDFDEGYRKYELIKKLDGGKMNAIRQRGAFVRRFTITPGVTIRRAKTYAENQNLAFCKEEGGLWSWWSTGRWGTTAIKLPPMPYAEPVAREYFDDRYESIRESLRTGEAGEWGYQTPALGYAKPWGVPYQGMTGGEGISFVDGTLVGQAASVNGYNMWDLEFRMNLDRMPVGIWNEDGRHTQVEEWLRENDDGDLYLPDTFYHRPKAQGDMFGFSDADDTHVLYVEREGLEPGYQEELFNFQSHDLQHYSRWLRVMRPLIWLGNDTLAKLMTQAAGNIAKMSCLPYANSHNGYTQGFNLLRISQKPADLGGGFGRDGGWTMDAVNMHYAFAPQEWRESTLDWWYPAFVDTMDHVQVPCNGAIQASDNEDFLGGNYRSAQTFETAIMQHGFFGVFQRALDGVDENLSDKLRLMVGLAVKGLKDWASQTPEEIPRVQVAVTSEDSSEVYCTEDELPEDGYNDKFEGTLTWQAWAVGFLLTGDESFMQKARTVAENTDDWEDWMQSLADYESVRWSEQSEGQNLAGHILLYQTALEYGF